MFKPYFTVEEIENATNGLLQGKIDKNQKVSLSTDTRTITDEDAYIALCGKVFDGHNFVEQAFNAGAQLAIIDKNHACNVNHFPCLIVEDTQKAYLQLANFHRNKMNAKIIGITGSSGKTTTKELFWNIFNSKYNTQKSIKNHNNEIGLCQTLLSITPETQYCIVEMGMRGLGEIDLLAKYAQPEIAVITNAGSAHIGILGSLENIAKAKCEIANYLNNDDIFIGHDNELIRKNLKESNYKKIFYNLNEVKILNKTQTKSEFEYDGFVFEIPDNADFNILNSLCAIKAAKFEGFSNDEIQKGLLEFENIEFRNELIELENGTIVISDCYNANPDSTEASLKHISEAYKDKRIIVVFGDMFELGEFEEKYHRKIGKLINDLNVNYFVSVGNLAKITAEEVQHIEKQSFSTTDEAAKFLLSVIDKDSLVFLKASRGMSFEKILEIIREK